MDIGFHHGLLSEEYEEQANNQGFTLGEQAEHIQTIGNSLIYAHINECITDSELNRILKRFQKNMLVKNLKPLKGGD